jgi:hypothetical protein
LFDAFDIIVDPDSPDGTNGLLYYPKDGYINASDGVHLTTLGAYYYGRAAAEAFRKSGLFSPPKKAPSNSLIYNTNSDLSGTGGSISTGASGQCADNTRIQRASGSNLACVASKESNVEIDGILYADVQKLVFSGATVDNEEFYFYCEYPDTPVAFDGSQGLEFIVPIKIEGAVGMRRCYLYGRQTISGTTYTTKDLIPTSNNGYMPADVEVLLRTEAWAVPSGTPTTEQKLIRISFDGTISGNGATIYVGHPVIRQLTV